MSSRESVVGRLSDTMTAAQGLVAGGRRLLHGVPLWQHATYPAQPQTGWLRQVRSRVRQSAEALALGTAAVGAAAIGAALGNRDRCSAASSS